METFEKTFNNVINGHLTDLYGVGISTEITNIDVLSEYICYYFDLLGANQSKIVGIREYSRQDIMKILENIYGSAYNCINTPLFSAMLEVAYEINDHKAIFKLEKVVEAYEKEAMQQPKTIVVLRDFYEREY